MMKMYIGHSWENRFLCLMSYVLCLICLISPITIGSSFSISQFAISISSSVKKSSLTSTGSVSCGAYPQITLIVHIPNLILTASMFLFIVLVTSNTELKV